MTTPQIALRSFLKKAPYYATQTALVLGLAIWLVSMIVCLPYLLAFALWQHCTENSARRAPRPATPARDEGVNSQIATAALNSGDYRTVRSRPNEAEQKATHTSSQTTSHLRHRKMVNK